MQAPWKKAPLEREPLGCRKPRRRQRGSGLGDVALQTADHDQRCHRFELIPPMHTHERACLSPSIHQRLRALLMAALLLPTLPGPALAAAALPMAPCLKRGQRHWDVLVVGDEPAGVMTALELADQLPRLTGLPHPRIALVTEADTSLGLGGVIARAGLAYLDRNQVPKDMWDVLGPFAPSSQLYERFLRITGVKHIAVDRHQASAALTKALKQAHIPVLSRADLVGVEREGRRVCVLQSRRYGRLGADLLIDASLGARAAHLAGVSFQEGLGPRELAHQSLALGWIFEVRGLSLQQLRILEENITQKLLNPRDREAQAWLELWPRYRKNPKRLMNDLLDENGDPQLAYSNTIDSADQGSPALAIAFHGESGLGTDLSHTPARLDQANIAQLPGKLSFNALLLRNNATQNRIVLADQNRPLPWMVPYAEQVSAYFLRHGAKQVEWMPELYVRSADQLAHPVAVLGDTEMANGGVPRSQALGTFSYFLDFRGGLKGIGIFPKPTFNFGYRHTLPRELDNLAVLGPAAGYGGLGGGAGRILELNISIGQGLAIAAGLSLADGMALAAIDPVRVARLMPPGFIAYGRPSNASRVHLFLGRLRYLLEGLWPRPEDGYWESQRLGRIPRAKRSQGDQL